MINKLKIKKIILLSVCSLAILIGCILPAFAYNINSVYLTVEDLSLPDSITYNDTVSYNANADDLYASYDYESHVVSIYLMDFDNPTTIYSFVLPYYYKCDVVLGTGSEHYDVGTTFYNDLGSPTSISYTITSTDDLRVTVTVYPDKDKLYNSMDLNDAFLDGVRYVVNNPSIYQLYTLNQYLSYGSSEFSRGQTTQNVDYADGYAAGKAASKEAVGLANVFMTGIYQVFNNFVNHTGVFGVSLAAVLVSAIIILIVFFIFKAVKG